VLTPDSLDSIELVILTLERACEHAKDASLAMDPRDASLNLQYASEQTSEASIMIRTLRKRLPRYKD